MIAIGAVAGDAILAVAATDPALTGGIVGFGRRARSVLPASWLDGLQKGDLAAESSRRRWQIANGLPGRTFVAILSWNLLGAYAGSLAFGLAERTPLDALLGHAWLDDALDVWRPAGAAGLEPQRRVRRRSRRG